MLHHHPGRFYDLHGRFLDAHVEWPSYEFAFASEPSLLTKHAIVCACPNPAYQNAARYAMDLGLNKAAFDRFKELATEAWLFLPDEFKGDWSSEFADEADEHYGQWFDVVYNLWIEGQRGSDNERHSFLDPFGLSAECIVSNGLLRQQPQRWCEQARDHFGGFAKEFYHLLKNFNAVEYVLDSVRAWSRESKGHDFGDAPLYLGDDPPLSAKHAVLVALHDCFVSAFKPTVARTGERALLLDPFDGESQGDAAAYHDLWETRVRRLKSFDQNDTAMLELFLAAARSDLERRLPKPEPETDDGSQPIVNWSKAVPPAKLRQVFGGISQDTLKPMLDSQKIRNKRLTEKLYLVDLADVPESRRDELR